MKTVAGSIESEMAWSHDAMLILPERVNVQTVPIILKQIKKSGKTPLGVDFSQVRHADSVALALLLCWQSQIQQPLRVLALPTQLRTLVPLYDLEDILLLAE